MIGLGDNMSTKTFVVSHEIRMIFVEVGMFSKINGANIVSIIGRAKRAPHWGVQSRFWYVGCDLKCVGGITYAHT